jgi:DNA-binding response OmpR family regulator
MVKVLIAEDELMIADTIEEALVENGYEVCGIARSVDEAVALARDHRPDLAVIDLRLADGGLGTEIAVQFAGPDRFGILYASGNVSCDMLNASDGEAFISKPYGSPALLLGLEIVIDIIAKGKTSKPFPRGFHLLEQVSLSAAGAL